MTGSRRQLLLGAGAVAAAAGVGVALWRTPGGTSTAAHPVFQHRFPTPDGGELVMSTLLGRPLLLNFWATWCPPCVREMPLLDAFRRDRSAAGWQVVGLAVDGPTPVREFLQRSPVGFPIGLAGFDGAALSKELGNRTGGLPFTARFDRGGQLKDHHLGELEDSDLRRWAEGV
jgi:thiol-disulfide isomerase/thioredoxin